MTVPHDSAAEAAVVGVCLNTRHGVARLELRPEDFHNATYAALFAAALAMIDVVTLEERVAFAVDFSGAPEALVRRLISASPVMFDATPWAKKVAACAEERCA